MAQFIKAVTKEEESRAMAFFKSIASSVDKFSDEEMIDFQFEVIKLVRTTQKRKGNDSRQQWNPDDEIPYAEYYDETRQSTTDIPGTSYTTRPGYSTKNPTPLPENTATYTDLQSVSSVETTYTEEFNFDFSKEYE